jgi:hypothetical protein
VEPKRYSEELSFAARRGEIFGLDIPMTWNLLAAAMAMALGGFAAISPRRALLAMAVPVAENFYFNFFSGTASTGRG